MPRKSKFTEEQIIAALKRAGPVRMKLAFILIIAALAACASREPRPDNLIVLQPEDAGPELDVPLNPSRPGGPLDIKPGDAWLEPPDAGAPVQSFPMRAGQPLGGSFAPPTENPMPGAFPPHSQQ